MTTEVTKLTTAQTAADEALAVLDEAWAYYTPEETTVVPHADDVAADGFVFYYDAA